MTCPECAWEGKTSIVFVGESSVTLLYSKSFYDTFGSYHHHDPNWYTTKYTCTKGHAWEEKVMHYCWCGWPGGKEADTPDGKESSDG